MAILLVWIQGLDNYMECQMIKLLLVMVIGMLAYIYFGLDPVKRHAKEYCNAIGMEQVFKENKYLCQNKDGYLFSVKE